MFEVSPDWCQLDRAKPIIQSYRTALQAAVRDRDELRECCVRCCRCEIEFLTVPANARRQNLRCPFGCRQLHRRQQSNQRSTDYYRTDAGRYKKKMLNARRQLQLTTTTVADDSYAKLQTTSTPARSEVQPLQAVQVELPVGEPAPTLAPASSDAPNSEPAPVSVAELAPTPSPSPSVTVGAPSLSIQLPGLQLTEAMLEQSVVLDYVLLLYLLIGRLPLTREQLLARLVQRMRQHSLVHLNRREYVVQWLHKPPP